MSKSKIRPFKNCPALDGYHCQTNSLAKIYHYNKHPLSEDMLLGLGSGMGFIYWHSKMTSPFIGGLSNKNFFQDLSKRTGVKIEEKSTSSINKAERDLIDKLEKQEPVMVFGDMGFLPWFNLPKGYHFGGHTFIICGYDGKNTVLASDMDPKASGLKKGFYYPITLSQLSKARNSKHKPFPPKNVYLEFNFKQYHVPSSKDIYSALKQTADSMLNAPISNVGIKGMRRTAKEILKWPKLFNNKDLRLNLFNIYIFTEIGGTGGGCFRYMYSRFLKESSKITKNKALLNASKMIHESGKLFTDIGLLFKNAEHLSNTEQKIKKASEKYLQIADLEQETWEYILKILKEIK